jgi:glycosyltransferase involved in cell wall biosynthesis
VLVVDDGMPPDAAARLGAVAAGRPDVDVLRLEANRGKGHAIAAGIARLAPVADAVLVLDADGQHPVAAVPDFLAADGDLVIGDRSDRRATPFVRRVANAITNALLSRTTGTRMRDSQCGMRLLRSRALAVPFPGGRYEAETRHLKSCVRAGLNVAWVPIPTIYGAERSSFRRVRDSLLVLAAVFSSTTPAAQSASQTTQPVP